MNRLLVLSALILLGAQATPARAAITAINVTGKFSDGSFVNVVCSVGPAGQVSGTGVLYGTNPQNGYTYRYPFVIKSGSTAPGKLVLTGNFAAGPPVTL